MDNNEKLTDIATISKMSKPADPIKIDVKIKRLAQTVLVLAPSVSPARSWFLAYVIKYKVRLFPSKVFFNIIHKQQAEYVNAEVKGQIY